MLLSDLFAANEATWPAGHRFAVGGFTVREGGGGGRRVSCATCDGDWTEDHLDQAEVAMAGLGQPPQFMIRPGDERLDAGLAQRGYRVVDPTVIYAAPIPAFEPAPDPMTAFPHWPPLAITQTLWAGAGIGPARLAVMHRAPAPRAAVLGRSGDRPAGAAFVAVHGTTAMLHALAVPEPMRRTGIGATLLRRAAVWAGENGALALGVAVTEANAPARALYASLGMKAVGQYHYRVK
ncbi:MAG: GNAT family N-acetyltransferase [Rhodobacter sp.]|nr:GNAT family N-acetyltransferase [Rhodobacter sp.]